MACFHSKDYTVEQNPADDGAPKILYVQQEQSSIPPVIHLGRSKYSNNPNFEQMDRETKKKAKAAIHQWRSMAKKVALVVQAAIEK